MNNSTTKELNEEVSGKGIKKKGIKKKRIQKKCNSEPSTHPMVIFQTNVASYMQRAHELKNGFVTYVIAYIEPCDETTYPYKKLIYDYIDEKTNCIEVNAVIDIEEAITIPRILFEKFLTIEEIFSLFADVEECCRYLEERNCLELLHRYCYD